MRLVHTSDWHLGRSLGGVGLLGAQALVLDDLVATVRREQVDAVLVSGDVYDKALPNPDAVTLLSETFERLVDAGAQVVVTSGNHDSAIRLGFASRLLQRAGLHVRTSLAEVGTPVLVAGVAIYPLPYLEPALTADALQASRRSHAAVLEAAMTRVRADLASRGGPSVVMGHAFVSGGLSCESERDISIGGVAAVPVQTFAGVSYAALGHLHGRQQAGPNVHYSGSPVAMSFGEAGHVKGYAVVEIEGMAAPRVELVRAPVERALAVLRGRLEELLTQPQYAAAEPSFVAVTLTDPVRPLGAMDRIRRRFPHAIKLEWQPEGGLGQERRTYAARIADRSDLDICCDFLAHVRGGVAAGPGERRLLREAVEASRVGRAVREEEGVVTPASGVA